MELLFLKVLEQAVLQKCIKCSSKFNPVSANHALNNRTLNNSKYYDMITFKETEKDRVCELYYPRRKIFHKKKKLDCNLWPVKSVNVQNKL